MHTGGQRLCTLGTAAVGQLDSPAASFLPFCTIRSPHPRVAALGCTHGPSPSPAAQQYPGPHWPHTATILWSDTWGLLWGLHQASQCRLETNQIRQGHQPGCRGLAWASRNWLRETQLSLAYPPLCLSLHPRVGDDESCALKGPE